MVVNTLKMSEEKPLKYPKSVAFIITNEFCERFNYYGMRTILVLYLTSKLHYDKDTSTVLFHVFTMMVYLCPLVGAIIADSWLGKYKTILYLSIVYAVGGIIIATGAIPLLHLPIKAVTILGLLLIAVGTGGIKPCVSAFGGDQFCLPEQAKQLATFFSLFYFAINAGSMISTSITPVLREDVHCFGDKDCFSLAFGIPAILMLCSVLVFIAGKKLYVMKPPEGNMMFDVTRCISDAIGGWRRNHNDHPRKHWLDYAEPTCGEKLVSDTKLLFKILVLYLPFPVFWALFDQQGSRWTFQATRMDGQLWGYNIKPDQMQVINPLLILGFIPLFEYVLYPILAKLGVRRPLQKLTLGGLLAAVAFILSALVEIKLEATDPVKPAELMTHLRIYNGMPCSYQFETTLPLNSTDSSFEISPLGFWEDKAVDAPFEAFFNFNATSKNLECQSIAGVFKVIPGASVSYFIANNELYEFEDSAERSKLGNPLIRVLLNIPINLQEINLADPADVITELSPLSTSQVVTVVRGNSVLTINGKLAASVNLKPGGVYSLIVQQKKDESFDYKLHVITDPNSLHIMWQLPQIIVITAAEIMFSVTGLEFSFTQAPQSMKSVLQACWLLSVAIGNMLVVVVAELKIFQSQAAEFVLFAALMVVDIFIFMLIAMRYKYVVPVDELEGVTTAPIEANGKNVCSPTNSNTKCHTNSAYEEDQ